MKAVIYLGAHNYGHKFFFFKEEEGIRGVAVTGVQTCALPIFEKGEGARDAVQGPDDPKVLRQLGLLTAKPILYAANVDEATLARGTSPGVDALLEAAVVHHRSEEHTSELQS